MLLRLPNVLTNDQLGAVRQLLANAKYVDGKLSAGVVAKRVKHNEELEKHASQMEMLNNIVMVSLVQHSTYRRGAMPLHVAAPFYARYTPGMTYGDHLDDPIMGTDGVLYRSDIAVTIFLNGPDNYDGGELVINTAFGINEIKLPEGDAVMYPASSLHRVNEVTRGERLVAITWVQSLIRDPARRELLYELNLAREQLLKTMPQADETSRVNAAYMNLVRMWSDI
ncbi:MAG: Fe2+-dependent dioxygenase [Sulfuricaulis sp.]